MTYLEYVTRLQTMLATDSMDVDLASILPACIEYAELRCLRDIQPMSAVKVYATFMDPGADSFAVPDDYVAFRQLVSITGTRRNPLLARDTRFFDVYSPDNTVLGIPKYWGHVSDVLVKVAPAAVALVGLELQYLSRPAGLSEDNPTTWLSLWAPDLMLSAAMVFLAGYSKNYGPGGDPGQSPFWDARYGEQLAGLKKQEIQKRGMTDTPA